MRYFLLLVVSILVSSLSAEPLRRDGRRAHTTRSPKRIADLYIDSLTIYRRQIDSLIAVNDSLRKPGDIKVDGRYFQLFSPLNFYHDVSGVRLGMNRQNDDTPLNNALLHIYMSRPELVKNTDNRFQSKVKGEQEEEGMALTPKFVNMKDRVVKVETEQSEMEELKDKPIDLFVAKPNFWKFSGTYYLQFLQNYISPNWYKGGSDNYSMLGTVTMQYDYNNKQKVKWSNKLEMKLGFQNSESDTVNTFKAVDDLIRYTANVGLQAHKDWYYTLQVVANTQFAQGRKNNDTKVYSDFMSPFNLNVSIGMDYSVKTKNERLKGNIHLAPLAYNLKYVDRLALSTSFGLEEGHHTLHDYGSQYLIELDWIPFDMFKWHTRLYGYTTYEKYEMEWENTFTFNFGKYISANLFLYPRFDDSAKRVEDYNYWQFKEYFSLGFTYTM